MASLLADALADAVIDIGADACGRELTYEEFVHMAKPRLRVPHHPMSVPLLEVDAFAAALRARFDDV